MKFKEYLKEETKLTNDIVTALLVDRPALKKKSLSLPTIPKGKYIGTMPAHKCETNVSKGKKQFGGDIYEGYIIWPDNDEPGGWDMASHTFNVVDGNVKEMTKLDPDIRWKDVIYIGKKIKK